jgi:hypothetical protein
MISFKRSLIMLATGAALAVSGSLGASAVPAGSPSTAVAPAASKSDNGITFVDRRRYGGNRHGHHRGFRNNFFFATPFIAAPFFYDDYGDYGYSYRYGGSNSCYRHCRYDHGPRFCRYHWEDYC